MELGVVGEISFGLANAPVVVIILPHKINAFPVSARRRFMLGPRNSVLRSNVGSFDKIFLLIGERKLAAIE
jgi:hypothetical protein